MPDSILSVRGLTKHYGHAAALDHVNVTIEPGQIYGLVGKNGAGKTTLIRMITAQSIPDAGEVSLFGETTPHGLNQMRRRTGAVVETPSFFPYLDAWQNLEFYRLQRGIPGREIIGEALEEVGLADTGRKKFKNFSLGMKQRLGLALAIMGHPDFLILDEPINGLDPMGIVQFRNILLKLNHEKGITILISSHILSELSNLATHYGFIDKGRMVEQLSMDELQDRCRECLELTVDDAAKTAAILEEKLGCRNYEILPQNRVRVYAYLDAPQKVSHTLIESGIELSAINVRRANLEDYFISLVGGEDNA